MTLGPCGADRDLHCRAKLCGSEQEMQIKDFANLTVVSVSQERLKKKTK